MLATDRGIEPEYLTDFDAVVVTHREGGRTTSKSVYADHWAYNGEAAEVSDWANYLTADAFAERGGDFEEAPDGTMPEDGVIVTVVRVLNVTDDITDSGDPEDLSDLIGALAAAADGTPRVVTRVFRSVTPSPDPGRDATAPHRREGAATMTAPLSPAVATAAVLLPVTGNALALIHDDDALEHWLETTGDALDAAHPNLPEAARMTAMVHLHPSARPGPNRALAVYWNGDAVLLVGDDEQGLREMRDAWGKKHGYALKDDPTTSDLFAQDPVDVWVPEHLFSPEALAVLGHTDARGD